MHITGKEKTLAAKPVHEVLVAGAAVWGELDVVGNDVLFLSHSDLFRRNAMGA
jgi:hypothetical protein